MGLFTDVSVWNPIYQIETTDPVIGGVPTYNGANLATGGYANAAAKRLADRTKFLLDGVANATLIANGAYPTNKRNAVLSGTWDNTTKLPSYLRIKPATTTILQLQTGTVLSFAAGFDANGRAVDFIAALTSNIEITPTYSSAAKRHIVATRNTTTGVITISALSIKPVSSYTEPDQTTNNLVWFNLSNGKTYLHNGTIFQERQICLVGELVFNTSPTTTINRVLAYDVNPRDIGVIRPVAAQNGFISLPNDDFYLTCDGTAIDRQIYAELFQRIGTTYGVGNGSTTFNLPNLTSSTESTGSPTFNLQYQIKYQ